MTEQEIDTYYKEWETVGKIYTQGDYFDIFKSSDFMITDCLSFLAEYLPTTKPLIRPLNPYAVSLNEYGKKIVKGFYETANNEELTHIFGKLLLGDDAKKEIRINSIKHLLGDVKIAEKIFKILKEWLV